MAHKTIEAHGLPLDVREDLCRSLLAEFGATSVHTRRDDNELNVRCVLPWHDEKRPSASLNWEKLTYRCQGCDSKGGLFWLIGHCRGESSTQARAWLREQSGQGAEGYSMNRLVEILDAIYGPKSSDARVIPKMSMKLLTPYYNIHPYLTEMRKVPVENIKALRVGYGTFDIKTGEDENGHGIFTKSERIIIPLIWRGDLVGWQTRRLVDDGTPKYQASPDFPRDRTLYDHQPGRRKAVVVESPLSVLRHRHHLPIVGTFGAGITDKQVRLLAEYPQVVVWLDPDKAGYEATLGKDELYEWGPRKGQVKEHTPGLVEKLLAYSDVSIVSNPFNADAADMDDDTAEELVEAALPPSIWQKPAKLLCWMCRTHHKGKCEGKAA